MKRAFFSVLVLILSCGIVAAQTVRTGVVIVGNGNAAAAAGIQSAISGVKTTLILLAPNFEVSALSSEWASGIEAELLKRSSGDKGDSKIDYSKVPNVLESWTDTLKNLSVMKGTGILKLKRAGAGWNIELTNGKVIKAEVLIDADQTGAVAKSLQLSATASVWTAFSYDDFRYRTSLAAGNYQNNEAAKVLFFNRLINPEQDNLIILNSENQSFAAGQAVGATAAYAVFFKKKTSEANMKVIQGELLNYKLALVPFVDVLQRDTNFTAVQKMGLSGFLKGEIADGKLYFRPGLEVSTAEIKEPIKTYYYKAQIWFDDHKEEKMTLNSTLKMIAYVGGYSLQSITKEVEKNWKKSYGFVGEFDGARVITRREFAVLAQYLKPFNVMLDNVGKVVR